MKLPMPCMQCALEKGEASIDSIARVEVRDDGRYETTCPNGHKSITVLQEQKFEILFDIGAYAISDGYYREAVSSFTSSLERFYEFFITAVFYEKGIDDAAFNNSWKLVARQSERQLGAFIFLHTNEFKRPPMVLREKDVQFRNDVIHRGRIPSKIEALAYGQVVLDLIRPILRDVREKYPKGMQRTIFKHLNANRRDPAEQNSTMTIATILGLSRPDEDWDKRPLVQAIEELRRWE